MMDEKLNSTASHLSYSHTLARKTHYFSETAKFLRIWPRKSQSSSTAYIPNPNKLFTYLF